MHNEINVAVGVLTNVAGEVLVAQRRADVAMPGAWEFPGGKLDAGETALAALERELREELGIEITYLRFLARLDHAYGAEFGQQRVRLHCWQVLAWTGQPHPAENQMLEWIQPDRLFQRGLLEADLPLLELLTSQANVNTVGWRRTAEAAGLKV